MPASRKTSTVCLLACAVVVGTLTAASNVLATADRERQAADAVSGRRVEAARRALASVVTIHAYNQEGEEYGSGIVVDGEGRVLTALHVVGAAGTIAVRLKDGPELPGVVVARDAMADLALLELRFDPASRDKVLATLRPATFGSDAAVRVGESVLVIGNPFGLGWSVTHGILSGRNRKGMLPGSQIGLLQTDAPINPGCSGGALVNMNGEVVGLVSAILTRNGGHQGVGFAVPAQELTYALAYLRRGEAVQRAWLGMRVKPGDGVAGERGLLVLHTHAEGPASKAGLKEGDLLLRLNGRRVEDIPDLKRELRRIGPEKPVRLGIRRKERLLDLWTTTGTLTKP